MNQGFLELALDHFQNQRQPHFGNTLLVDQVARVQEIKIHDLEQKRRLRVVTDLLDMLKRIFDHVERLDRVQIRQRLPVQPHRTR